MISILRPSTPPLALISSAASCAACGMDAPAIACASAITPILIGSAANAAADAAITALVAAAPSAIRNTTESALFISFSLPLNRPLVSHYVATITARALSASETAFRIVRDELKSSAAQIAGRELLYPLPARSHADFGDGHARQSARSPD